MQLNHHRIDHTTLYRGGGYIEEDGNMLKLRATHFSSRVHHSYHHLIPHSKISKNDKHVHPRDINDTTNSSTQLLQCILLYKVSLYIVVSKGAPLHHSSTTKVAITFLLTTQF